MALDRVFTAAAASAALATVEIETRPHPGVRLPDRVDIDSAQMRVVAEPAPLLLLGAGPAGLLAIILL